MAVELTATSKSFVGTGAAANYTPGFYANSASQVKVYVNGVLKVLGDDYTVTGLGNSAGVTVNGNFASGSAVLIDRQTPITQLVDTQNNETILEDVLDGEFDKLTMIDQEQQTQFGRALMVPKGETAPAVVGMSTGEGKLLQVVGGQVVPSALPDATLLAQANAALVQANAAVATVAGALAPVTRYAPRPRRWASPSGMNNPLGLAIDCDGSKYGFSSDPYALNDWTNGATGITHLYVAPVAGNDANPGTTTGSPWKSLDKVVASAPDKSVVHFIEPYCDYNAALAGSFDFAARKIKLISDVSIGTLFTTWRVGYNLAFMAWVADGSAYKSTAAMNGAAVQSMFDRKYLDIHGLGLPLIYVASSALVKSTPGSWWWDGGTGTLWVHMIDDRVPDPATGWTPITSFGGYNFLTDSHLVIENCEFGYHGGGANSQALRIRPTTAFVTNDAKVALRKVKAYGSDGNAVQIMDFDTTVLQECAASECFYDMFNYSSFISTGIQAQDQTVYEDRCHGHNAGSTISKNPINPSNSNNISTGHRGKHIYRVGSNGYGCPNSFIADVQGCYSMNAGIDPTESTKTGGLFLNNYWNQKLAGEGSANSKMILLGCSGEALSAGRSVFSNWDDSDTVASLGEIHLADWLGSPAASRKLGTLVKNYETGAAL